MLAMVCWVAALRPAPLARARAPSPRMAGGAGSLAGGGGDLSGGGDDERNAQLSAMRRMFAADVPEDGAPASAEPGAAEDARRLGLFLDLPLCRFSWAVLPAHQLALNIWQPQYTLMFGALLDASPPPHYYMHVLLPGGADSLGKPEYALRPGSQAPLVGSLMRIVYSRREPDSRLTLVVQALSLRDLLTYLRTYFHRDTRPCRRSRARSSCARRRRCRTRAPTCS